MTADVLLQISDQVAMRLLAQMLDHADDSITGACTHCRRHRCVSWQDAYAELAAAGRIDAGSLSCAGHAGDHAPPAESTGGGRCR